VPAEENKAVFRRYIEEVQNQGNLEVADEIFGHYISHQSDGSTLQRGPEDVKRFTEEYRSAFPDWRISIDEQIAEGDKVVNRVTLRGTHQRQFRDMAPTGKEVELKAVTIFRFSEEGKVVETWDFFDQLRLMRQSIAQELRVARSIQEASLPKEVPTLEGWQISPRYQPAREVGGDFYDFLATDQGWIVLIGDVTGKGVEAAAMTSMVRHGARFVGEHMSDPARILARLDAALRQQPTLSLCSALCLLIAGDRIMLASAGHPLPLLVTDDGVRAVGTAGPVLGAFEDGEWPVDEVLLRRHEVMLLYTDGVTDTVGPKGRFGEQRLEQTMAECGPLAVEELLGCLDKALSEFQIGPQADDTAALALRLAVESVASEPALASAKHGAGQREAA
jgi:serine phosphatase RsbU (regulator of sigma subunit)